MNEQRVYDLLVIGSEIAGYTAALAGARLGFSVGLLSTGLELADEDLVTEPSNAVWRQLGLDMTGFQPDPISALVSLDSEANARIVQRSIDSFDDNLGPAQKDEALWPEFIRELEPHCSPHGEERPVLAGMAHSRFETAQNLLDDFFSAEELKRHVANSSLLHLGLAGDETGSSRALAECVAGWPMTRAALTKLRASIQKQCTTEGVLALSGSVESVVRKSKKNFIVTLVGGEMMRAKRVCISSAELANAAGLRVQTGANEICRRKGVTGSITLHFNSQPDVSDEGASALYFLNASRDTLLHARDAMVEGRIPDEAPISFEISGKKIIARSYFCPAVIVDEDGRREWTSQDRQVLGRQIAERISAYLSSDSGNPRKIDVSISPSPEDRRLRKQGFLSPELPAPAPGIDKVGLAVALINELFGND